MLDEKEVAQESFNSLEGSEQQKETKCAVFKSFVGSHAMLWFWIMVAAVVVIIILLAFYGKYIEIITYQYENVGSDSIDKFKLDSQTTENYSYYSRIEENQTINDEVVYQELIVFLKDSFVDIQEPGDPFWLFFHSGSPLTVKYTLKDGKSETISLGNIYKENQIPTLYIENYENYEFYLEDDSSNAYCFITKMVRDSIKEDETV